MTNKQNTPPPFAVWLLSRMLRSSDQQAIIGDFEESYLEKKRQKGVYFAGLWYWMQVIQSIPALLNNSIIWSCVLLKNYCKIAKRNIVKYKVHSAIHIFGFSAALSISTSGTPDSARCIASAIYGPRIRLTTNPGKLRHPKGNLPLPLTKAKP